MDLGTSRTEEKAARTTPQLIVALDVPHRQEALRLVETLREEVDFFKVGLQLFLAEGPPVVQEIRHRGCSVFLDLKLHDIPNIVVQGALSAARLGVQMMTVHALGGITMMQRTREALEEFALREKCPPPRLLAVTVLTSMGQEELRQVGMDLAPDEAVVALARAAAQAGLSGIVCSPRELPLLKGSGLSDFLFVTPGIRPGGSGADDQVRTMTAAEAVREGAHYLVVGRPITRAPDPLQATRTLLAEIQSAKI